MEEPKLIELKSNGLIENFIINESTFKFLFFRAMNRDLIDKYIVYKYINNDTPTDFRILPVNQRFKIIDRLFNLTAIQWYKNINEHEQALGKLVAETGKKETIEKIIQNRKVSLASAVLCKELALFILDDEYGDNALKLNAELSCTPPYSELPNYWLSHIPTYIKHIIEVIRKNKWKKIKKLET